jgi:hypothetical protein
MNAKTAAIIIGLVFLVIGILGFFNNPVIGLFAVNTAHNLVHIVSGLLILAGAMSTFGAGNTLKVFGVIYAIIAILGLLGIATTADGMLLGFIQNNPADNWLHVVLAVVILAAGFLLPDDERRMAM